MINRTGKSFSILLSGFTYATSLFFSVVMGIPIIFGSSSQAKIFMTLTVKQVKLTISQVKLTTSISQVFELGTIGFTFHLVAELANVATTIYLRKPITFMSSAIQKLVVTLTQHLPIGFDPTLAEFYILGDFDPDTLGDHDADTLGDMDYVAS